MQTQSKSEAADCCPECGQPMERVYLSAAGQGFLVCQGGPPVGFVAQTKAAFTAKQVCDESGMPVLGGIVNDFPAMHCRPCRRIMLRYG
jgi:ssDNA-binding Zn-finger/Zn-ribbon topoisomerase 1